MGKNIGFVSTRFAGIDGVTLEASKWAVVFEKNGFNCFWFAGELDRDSDKSFLVPEAHFQHEQNRWINAQVMGSKVRTPAVTQEIHDKLGRGLLAIARFDAGYEVIPSVVAEKIMLRDESCIVSNVATQPEDADDDSYADYKVPDDLMW